MLRVYREYERRKTERGEIDFEDLLELAVRLFDGDERALAAFQDRYRAFTVDEYQDVNLLQQALLDRWLGDRRSSASVGDDYQSIYAFTGAPSSGCSASAARFPQATVVRLEDNYRSTPEVLELANRLVPRLGGAEKVLRPRSGPEPRAAPSPPLAAGERLVGELIARPPREGGRPSRRSRVLCRTNARLADFEEALSEAEIPSQGAALLSRDGGEAVPEGAAGAAAVGRPADRP